jgi:putative oxidoreductase
LIGVALCLNFLFMQMVDTFVVLVVQIGVAFQDLDPLLLTTEGEFVLKNLVSSPAPSSLVAPSAAERGAAKSAGGG